jgi:hypothetical protein
MGIKGLFRPMYCYLLSVLLNLLSSITVSPHDRCSWIQDNPHLSSYLNFYFRCTRLCLSLVFPRPNLALMGPTLADLKVYAEPIYLELKVHKIEIFFGFDFEICIISLLVV